MRQISEASTPISWQLGCQKQQENPTRGGSSSRPVFEGPRVSQSLAGIEEVSECVGDLWIV